MTALNLVGYIGFALVTFTIYALWRSAERECNDLHDEILRQYKRIDSDARTAEAAITEISLERDYLREQQEDWTARNEELRTELARMIDANEQLIARLKIASPYQSTSGLMRWGKN